MAILQEVINNVFSAINPGEYMNSGTVMQDAFNLASTTIYERHRDNFEVDQASMDYLQEQYQVLTPTLANPVVIPPGVGSQIVDVTKQIEVKYTGQSEWQPVQILPDNTYLRMASSLVIPPTTVKPIARLNSLFTYEILPAGYTQVQARVLCLPTRAIFSLVDNNSPVPSLDITEYDNWTEDKIPLMTFLTMTFLSLNPPMPLVAQFADQWAIKLPGQ